jgi:hypothetical protein
MEIGWDSEIDFLKDDLAGTVKLFLNEKLAGTGKLGGTTK